MAKIDLTSSEWCQLIFEGKNQAYGAYKMRANSTKRHNLAMFAVLVIALIGFTIPTLLKLATPKQKEVMTEVTTLSKLEEPEIKQEEMKRVEPVAPPPPALKSSIKFTAPVIKKDEEVHEDNEIKSQEELTSTKVAISIADVKGNDEENGADIADLKQVVTQAEPEPEKVFDMVEQMPAFPGGMQELMVYLGKNIKYPTIAQENGTQGRVTVQFIVNVDGSISNIGIIRGVDPELDGEAVRVISTMPNWKPGTQKGKPVRVKYTVPVMFRLPDEDKKEEYKPVPKIEETVVVGYGTRQESPIEEGQVFEVVEQMPSFPGGPEGLMRYISKNIKYPVGAQKAGTQGRVIVEVIIDANGNVTNPKVSQGVDPLLDAEAIRVTANMPKWQPGTQRGQAVNVKYTFPIIFKLQ